MTDFQKIIFDHNGTMDKVISSSPGRPWFPIRPELKIKAGQCARFTGNNIFVTDTDGQLLFHYRLEENAFVLQELADEG